ncbi:MAG: feoB [Gammaproteobacteria bacterium]|jgi:ferrous iron transport protein B|nr:feoB [Gammaproteobacteria bacterium]
MKSLSIAIVGNPNCGKTTLFNALTGSQQRVGNWAGVTVEKKEGTFVYQDHAITVVDLPGTYALTVSQQDTALDERVVCTFIDNREAALYINVVDAANLKRNLYLTLQLLEMGIPCIIALNMTDIAKQRGIDINIAALSQWLGCPVVSLIANKKEGLDRLCEAVVKHNHQIAAPCYQLALPAALQTALYSLKEVIACCRQKDGINAYSIALRLVEQDILIKQCYDEPLVNTLVSQIQKDIYEKTGEDCDTLIADARYQVIQSIAKDCWEKEQHNKRTLTERIDKVAMHRFWGIPFFLFTMYLMFEFSMNIGSLFQPLFDIPSKTLFVDGIAYLGQQWELPLALIAVLSQGIGLGINTIVNFIPQIGCLFLFLAFLEDSGYMARAAFVMDRLMQWIGLPGKSFVPLIIGFGCNVPSIMATRTLNSQRDRILTTLMSPFMSCGARLAIFVVFAQAFFPHHGGLVVFLLYLIGIIMAILTGLLFKKTLLRGESEPFFMELPIYHKPAFGNLWRLTMHKLKRFVLRAGKVILPMCVLIGTLNAIEFNGRIVPQGSPQSVLSQFSREITPLFYPMGISEDNWPATVGVITGFLAKEVVVGTLNTLYTQNGNSMDVIPELNLSGSLKSAIYETVSGFRDLFSFERINPFTVNEAEHEFSQSASHTMVHAFGSAAADFAYLLFVLLYIPCISTLATMAREIGKSWALLATGWSFLAAYTLATLCYQASIWLSAPFQATLWITALLSLNGLFIALLHYFGLRKEHRVESTSRLSAEVA